MQNQRLKNIAEPMTNGLVKVVVELERVKCFLDPEAEKCINKDDEQLLSVYSNIMVAITTALTNVLLMQKVLYSELTSERKLLSSIAWDEEDDITDLI